MAHSLQQKWCEDVKRRFSRFFGGRGKRALDIGSLDVNGNNRYLFDTPEMYLGLDVIPGKNVDIVCPAHEYDGGDGSFDVVLSTNTLEHDMHYKLTLQKMVKLLKPGGLMFFSAAHSWKEHGTRRTSPSQSGTSQLEGWKDYYKNLDMDDVRNSIDLVNEFEFYELIIEGKDLRFVGVKKGPLIAL